MTVLLVLVLTLVGVAGTAVVLAMVSFSQAVDQPSYLIVPLVLALVSVAGILVYTRLLAPRR